MAVMQGPDKENSENSECVEPDKCMAFRLSSRLSEPETGWLFLPQGENIVCMVVSHTSKYHKRPGMERPHHASLDPDLCGQNGEFSLVGRALEVGVRRRNRKRAQQESTPYVCPCVSLVRLWCLREP